MNAAVTASGSSNTNVTSQKGSGTSTSTTGRRRSVCLPWVVVLLVLITCLNWTLLLSVRRSREWGTKGGRGGARSTESDPRGAGGTSSSPKAHEVGTMRKDRSPRHHDATGGTDERSATTDTKSRLTVVRDQLCRSSGLKTLEDVIAEEKGIAVLSHAPAGGTGASGGDAASGDVLHQIVKEGNPAAVEQRGNQAIEQRGKEVRRLCHSGPVPFDPSLDDACLNHMQRMASFVPTTFSTTSRNSEGDGGGSLGYLEFPAGAASRQEEETGRHELRIRLEPMQQKFEQRTIKFRMDVHHRYAQKEENNDDVSTTVERFLVKVPQLTFRQEPFGEVAAYHMDRLLGIHRVPPTTLVPLPIDTLGQLGTVGKDLKMNAELQRGTGTMKYDAWILKDFVEFVSKPHSTALRHNTTHVYCSVQPWLDDVEPLLGSSFKAPYSKARPGWHRWMNPAFLSGGAVGSNAAAAAAVGGAGDGKKKKKPPYTGDYSVQLALSELTVFDYIIFNNDRSPNKNNFVIGASKTKPHRRADGRQMIPTFLHLDQGMSYATSGMTYLDHNAMGKRANNNTFCLLYRPLMKTIWCGTRGSPSTSDGRDWCGEYFHRLKPDPSTSPSPSSLYTAAVVEVLGKKTLTASCNRVKKVVSFLERCLAAYPPDVVLRP